MFSFHYIEQLTAKLHRKDNSKNSFMLQQRKSSRSYSQVNGQLQYERKQTEKAAFPNMLKCTNVAGTECSEID